MHVFSLSYNSNNYENKFKYIGSYFFSLISAPTCIIHFTVKKAWSVLCNNEDKYYLPFLSCSTFRFCNDTHELF